MKIPTTSKTFILRVTALTLLGVAAPLTAQTRVPGVNSPDPARWFQEDVTRQQKLSTAQKEATNAQQASIDACAAKQMNERQACIADARRNYAEDEAVIRRTFGSTK